MQDGFVKIAAATPDLRVADCAYNASEIIEQAKQAAARGAHLIVFPELCLTGYTCGDLFLQRTLLDGALAALDTVRRETAPLNAAVVVGLPLVHQGKLYNVAAVLCGGHIEGVVPKQCIPNYSEFYEARHFTSGAGVPFQTISLLGQDTLFAGGEPLVFQCADMPELTLGVEICEDLWVADPPSTRLAQAGATVIVNLSASDEIIGKAAYRRDLVRQQSARLLCAYLYADAGFGESTQDLVFAGHDLIAENGAMLAESRLFERGVIYADIDVQRLTHERRRMNTFTTLPNPNTAALPIHPGANDLPTAPSRARPSCPPARRCAMSAARRSSACRRPALPPACATRTQKPRSSACRAGWIPRSR